MLGEGTAISAMRMLGFAAGEFSGAVNTVDMLFNSAFDARGSMLRMLGSGTNKIANARVGMHVLLSANVVITPVGMDVMLVERTFSLC